jgi:site-specific DNA recombinase
MAMPQKHAVLFDNSGASGDGLAAWAERTGRRAVTGPVRGRLRFAFYGRVSTEDHQDPVTSRARQRDQAGALVAGHARIVAEYFDTGQSRTLSWARRPQAAALLAAMADPDRGFDAIVIGEYERAFCGGQYAAMAPLFGHYGIQLWTPESSGPIHFQADQHEQMMLALGWQSKREITRTGCGSAPQWLPRPASRAATSAVGHRTATGWRMRDRTRTRRTPLGGDAPTGWDPDPHTAPVVQWMFAQRLAGHSLARITRALNDAGIPCPSSADPKRNPHRSGQAWTLGTVAAILANPRYTGRQVWNRQRTDNDLIDPANTGLGHRQVQRWNLPDGWVISTQPAHPALVSEADFIAVQEISTPRGADRWIRWTTIRLGHAATTTAQAVSCNDRHGTGRWQPGRGWKPARRWSELSTRTRLHGLARRSPAPWRAISTSRGAHRCHSGMGPQPWLASPLPGSV